MLQFKHLCHAQRFYVCTVGIKDDIFDVGDGDFVPIKFDVHFPLAVLERQQLLVREGRSGAQPFLYLKQQHSLEEERRRWLPGSRLGNKAAARRELRNAISTHVNVYSNFLPSIRFPS